MRTIFIFIIAVLIGAIATVVYNIHTEQKAVISHKQLKTITSAFSVEKAPKESIRGTLSHISGDVEWESRTATQAAKIAGSALIQQGELVVTKETGSAEIDFPDIGQLLLKPRSGIDVIQTIPANAVFSQNSGTIEYIKNGIIPLSVQDLHLLIDEQSGDMIVSNNPDYPIITITVLKGAVRLAFNDIHFQSTVVDLSQGGTYVFHDDTRRGFVE